MFSSSPNRILTSLAYRLSLIGLLISIPFLHAVAQAQEEDPIAFRIAHTDQTPTIDGTYSAAEWGDATLVQLTNETHPSQNIPALVKTDVYVMEDGESLLLAFVAEDPEPEKIRAFYRDRDRAFQDDFVGVVIDTFNDERRGFEFFVNPLGVQMDLTQDDVARREDDSWNALWDSAGVINATGFVVEMRIPLKQIRFPSGLEQQTWGIDLLRFYPRDVRHRLSNNQTDYAASCYLCLLEKTQGFSNLEQSTNLQIIPTVTSLWTENRPKPATDSWQRDDPDFQGGADLRWGINEDMILNATLNPDFSQVEADNAQLDINNTFSLFFPERREFFLDGAEYFNIASVSSGNNNNNSSLVHTRNIHSPDYGAKLTGKSGNQTYGLMVTNDERTNFVIPGNQGSRVASLTDKGSDNLAMRYRYDYGRNLTVGVLGTQREADDYSNTVAATDINWRLSNSDRIIVQALHSESDYPVDIQTGFSQEESIQDSAWGVSYNHEGENFELNLSNNDYGKDFRADLGFITRVNYHEQVINPSYTWRPATGSFLTAIGVWTQWDKSWDQNELELEEENRAGLYMNGPMQSYMEIAGGTRQRYYNGRYFDEETGSIFAQFQPWGGAQFRFNINGGNTIDFANTQEGDLLTVGPGFTLQLGRHLQTQLNYNHQELDVSGGRLYTTDLVDLRLTWQFNNRSFIRTIFIHSDTERDPGLYRNKIDARSRSLNTQLLYSYRFSAQTRFFVGYSDSAIQNDVVQDLEGTNHTIFAKFSYAWQY
ncbi:MAG: DUF5916 domain-containing protein [Pseudomonadota bacterium]